jgi:hypothetical protein
MRLSDSEDDHCFYNEQNLETIDYYGICSRPHDLYSDSRFMLWHGFKCQVCWDYKEPGANGGKIQFFLTIEPCSDERLFQRLSIFDLILRLEKRNQINSFLSQVEKEKAFQERSRKIKKMIIEALSEGGS